MGGRGAETRTPQQSRGTAMGGRDITLLDLLDRLLDEGVVLHADVTLAVADVDLVYLGLRALISSVEAAGERR
jgi:gas vesicle structural protein